MYRCPLCQQSLTQHHNSFVCASNHSFDLAKEGYLHLLPVQQKNSKVPGDSPLMMQSRRDFLNAGYYQPLSDAVNQCFAAVLPQDATLLDLGCGEGYYSNRLFQALADKNLKVYGLDIANENFKNAKCRVATLCDYNALIEYATENSLVGSEDLKLLYQWRVIRVGYQRG